MADRVDLHATGTAEKVTMMRYTAPSHATHRGFIAYGHAIPLSQGKSEAKATIKEWSLATCSVGANT